MSVRKESYTYYEKTAQVYDKIRFQGISGRWGDTLQKKILLTLLESHKDKSILEVGCGTGRCTKMMLEFGCKNITAIEPAESMLRLAESRCEAEVRKGKVNFIQSDIDSISEDIKSFDIIILINVFSRLPDSKRKLSKLVRLLSENGVLIFNFQCLTSVLLPFGAIVNRKNISLNRPVYSRWYTPRQIKNMLTDLNLVVMKWSGHHYLPAPKYLFPLLPAVILIEFIISKFSAQCFPSLFVCCRQIKG